MQRNIKVLSDREHIYHKTEMYAGSVNLTQLSEFVEIDGKHVEKELNVVPALLKIINEIIDNSVDVHLKTPLNEQMTISVKMDKESITVEDNGRGIPVHKNDDGIYLPRICWGFARSGGNFDISENVGLGTFGVGSYITNVLSKKFIGVTDDSSQRYTITFTDNAQNFKETLSKTSKHGTKVTFYPDLERFSLSEITGDHILAIKQRLINLSLSFPSITFKFNGSNINIKSFKKFIERFDTNAEIFETENYSLAIMHNPNDDFRQLSYVNGLKILDGGTHIDVICNNVVNKLRDKLIKKYKTIKPADIKNKLFIVAYLRNFKNAKFNSQTKEKLTNAVSELTDYYNNIDYDALSKKILKNSSIIDPITEIYKIKEELKKRQELKSLNKVKKIKNEKYLPPIKEQKYLMIVEGECLDEHQKLLSSDFTSMTIKDINVGNKLLNKEFKEVKVLAKTKSLKETLTFKTNKGDVRCGYNHRLFAYDLQEKKFKFIEAYKLLSGNYKLVKSNINFSTRGIEILQCDFNSMTFNNGEIKFTEKDNFMILRNGMILKVNSIGIKQDDVILVMED